MELIAAMEKKVTRQRVGPNLRSTLGIERHLRLLDLPQDVVSIETNREGSLAECLGDACIPYDTVVVHAVIAEARALHIADIGNKFKRQRQLNRSLQRAEIGSGVR